MNLLAQYSIYEICIFSTLLVAFLYQLFTWLSFSTVATHRHTHKLAKGEPLPSVTVVVVLGTNGLYYIERGGLQKLLVQTYNGQWEVVVVNDCAGSELTEALEVLAAVNKNLRFTEIKDDIHFKHSRKIPLLVGIKAAKYDNIIIADCNANPISDKWLSVMARGFVGGSIVIGYTGFERGSNIFIRSSRFYTSLRYLRSAVMGNPYRGIYNNIGYTKACFFGTKGYTHLRLALGEDDLFIQKAAKNFAASVMLNPHATMRQTPYGGIGWWWGDQRYHSYAFKFYPFKVRFWIFAEILFRLLFFASVILAALLPYPYIWAYVGGLFLLRELILVWGSRRVMKRLGEKRLLFGFIIYDIIEPFTAILLSLSRRLFKPTGVWK